MGTQEFSTKKYGRLTELLNSNEARPEIEFNYLVLNKSQPRWNKKRNELISKSIPRISKFIQSNISGWVRNVKSLEIKKYILILNQNNMSSQRLTDRP